MATTANRLTLKFKDDSDEDMTVSYSDAKTTCGAGAVKSLMQSMIANKGIFTPQPTTMKSAAFVTTTTTEVDLS